MHIHLRRYVCRITMHCGEPKRRIPKVAKKETVCKRPTFYQPNVSAWKACEWYDVIILTATVSLSKQKPMPYNELSKFCILDLHQIKLLAF